MAKHRRRKPGPPRTPKDTVRKPAPFTQEPIRPSDTVGARPAAAAPIAEPDLGAGGPEPSAAPAPATSRLDPSASEDYPKRDYPGDVDPSFVASTHPEEPAGGGEQAEQAEEEEE